jgi:hypothetical protein
VIEPDLQPFWLFLPSWRPILLELLWRSFEMGSYFCTVTILEWGGNCGTNSRDGCIREIFVVYLLTDTLRRKKGHTGEVLICFDNNTPFQVQLCLVT